MSEEEKSVPEDEQKPAPNPVIKIPKPNPNIIPPIFPDKNVSIPKLNIEPPQNIIIQKSFGDKKK